MLAVKIQAMHDKYGSCAPLRCKDCRHCLKYVKAGGTVYKCYLYGSTKHKDTDWSPLYPACAMYDMEVDIKTWHTMVNTRYCRKLED